MFVVCILQDIHQNNSREETKTITKKRNGKRTTYKSNRDKNGQWRKTHTVIYRSKSGDWLNISEYNIEVSKENEYTENMNTVKRSRGKIIRIWMEKSIKQSTGIYNSN